MCYYSIIWIFTFISILNKFNCEVIGVIEDVLRQNPRFQITNEKLKNKISHNSNVNISKKQTYKMLLENEYKKNHELTQKPEWINIYTFKNNLIILNSENRIGKLDLSKILEKRKSNIDANQIDWDIYNFEIDELVCIKKDIYYYHKLNDDKLNWNILEI